MWGRPALLTLVALVLSAVTFAWLLRSGLWRRGRLWFLTVGVVLAIGVLARRVGWGELAVLVLLAFLPFFVVPARSQPGGQR